MKYKVELSREQAEVTAKALEFYSRFMAGDWTIPLELVNKEANINKYDDSFFIKRDLAVNLLEEAKINIFTYLERNSNYGIGQDDLHENAKTAYDVYRPFYEQFTKETVNPSGVFAHEARPYSKEGRIKIEVIK